MVKKAPEPLSKDDVHRILDASIAKEEDYLFLRLLIKTGRRIGEILAIRVMDINFDTREAYAPVEKKKRKQSRVIFLDPETCAFLKRHIAEHGLKRGDGLWSRKMRAMQNIPKKYARRAGLEKNVMAHSFRHYVVTSLRKQGWAWEDIAKITGHDPKSVSYYDSTDAYLKESDFREACKEL